MRVKIINTGVSNCYIIKEKHMVLIDTGMPGRFEKFTSILNTTGIHPKEIKAIIITHSHWDHIGCAKKLKELTGAKVLVHRTEKNILENGLLLSPPGLPKLGRILSFLMNRRRNNCIIDPCKADIIVDEKSLPLTEFGIQGKVIFTPGHSLGSLSVVLDNGDGFVGDMAINIFPATAGPIIPKLAEDYSLLKKSWKKLISMGVKRIFPGHGKPFKIETIIKKL